MSESGKTAVDGKNTLAVLGQPTILIDIGVHNDNKKDMYVSAPFLSK